MKRFLIVTLLLVFGTLIVQAQRNVTWVGGLGDDSEFWAEYAQQFQTERNITSSNLDYATAGRVVNMAGQIPRAGANAIGIGHSLGGVALREIDQLEPRGRVGGIITVGSPLNGARIVRAGLRGEVNGYIDHGVNEVSKGPLRQSLGLGFIVIGASVIGRSLTGRGIIELLREAVFDLFDIDPFDSDAEEDLAEGSPYMNRAIAYRPNVPRISINGVESSPVHFRLASSAQGDDRDDDDFANLSNIARSVYNVQYIRNLATAFIPLNAWRAAGWKAGRDYFDSDSEKGWNNLIGATRAESRRSCYEVFVCSDYSCYDNIVTYEDYLACQDRCYQEQCRTITTRYNQPSDGLLHQSTQLGQSTEATRSNWNPNATFQAVGANHSEYDEHPGTRTIFVQTFNGTNGAPPFFATP